MKKIILFVANRFWVIFLLYITSLLLASGLFSYFEGKAFLDSLWWAVVTALTIGYGDISPVTIHGRIVGVFFGHFWIFCIIPMIVANIITKLLEDKDAFTHHEQEWQEKALLKIAESLDVKLDKPPSDY